MVVKSKERRVSFGYVSRGSIRVLLLTTKAKSRRWLYTKSLFIISSSATLASQTWQHVTLTC
jgi:hypothetical protein